MKIGFLKAFLFLILFIFCKSGFSQLPQFVREKIEITISDHFFLIEGDYYFLNDHSTPIKRNLFYPFPIDSTLLYPDSIKVTDVQKKGNISFNKVKTGIYFPVDIPPRKTVIYKVFYSQKVTIDKAEYILTTTQKWGKSLETAEFIVKLPSDFELKFLSYEYDEKQEINNYFIYKIHKENFMPKKNLIIEWARRK